MRRLAHRPLALLPAASLVLSAATCVLWVQSHHTGDAVRCDLTGGSAGRRTVRVESSAGVLGVGYADDPDDHDPPAVRWHTGAPWNPLPPSERLSFAAVRSGRCVACGYDLRATPARCPECGTAPNPTAA